MKANKKGSISDKNRASHKMTESSQGNNNSSISLFEAEDSLRQRIADNGLGWLKYIPWDSGLFRFSVPEDKHNKKSGWIVAHSDGIPVARFGCWKTNIDLTWCYKKGNKTLSPDEKKALSIAIEKAKQERKAEQERKHKQARSMAHACWNKAKPASRDNKYIVKKNIQGIESYLREDNGRLIVPIFNNKRLVSLQFINENFSKYFLKNSELKGSFFMIGSLKKPFDKIMIAEGVSTSWTVHTLANQAPTFSAMNANNLKAVALSVRKHFPKIKIIVAGDNDQRTDGSINIGVEKAKEAAQAVGGYYSIPTFPDPTQKGDWNDLVLFTQKKLGANNE